MLREQSFFSMLVINILVTFLWHFAVFIICILAGKSFFDPDKKMYLPKKWEREGRFYSDILKINSWKDKMPRYTGKNGFSKEHLETLSLEYLDEFIMETCRGEWNHTANCLLSLVLMIINKPLEGIVLSLLVLWGNLPFAMIQRYNRFRLRKVRQIMLRKAAFESNRAAAGAGKE